MKNYRNYKTTQLFIYIIAALICFYVIVIKSDIYRLSAENQAYKNVCIIIWGLFAMGFVFLLIDVLIQNKQDEQFEDLDKSAFFDRESNMINRQGIDGVIAKYTGTEIPETLSCVMIILSSLYEVNEKEGTQEGDKHLKQFSIILNLASINKCIVGRNGGNVFLAIFEDKKKKAVEDFVGRIEVLTKAHNEEKSNNEGKAQNTSDIKFSYGIACNEDEKLTSIKELISIANTRAHKS